MNRLKKIFIILLGLWLVLLTSVVTVVAVNQPNPVPRAVLGMSWGLIILWVIIGGSLMYRLRDPIRRIVLRIPLPWQIKFVLFVTGLALLEEVITTLMTNLAPAFGVAVGEAYIVASTNFLDVVFFHSIINFVGPFVFWALVLRRYDFRPFATFLIFGLSGLLAEVMFSGPQHFAEFGLWIFIYGLMIYLPTYCLPDATTRGKNGRAARRPGWYLYILMIFLPVIFVPLFAWIPYVVNPAHPQPSHFAPMQMN